MTRAQPDRLERAARALHRTLLRAYPRQFRDDFGRDMDETFADRWREARARGEWSMLLLLLRTTIDTARHAAVARAATLPSRSDMFHLQDVRYAFRLLRRTPFFTLLTVVVLAGGMGVSVFTFSFLYSAILRPLPLSDGARIVRMQQGQGRSISGFDAADFARMRRQVTTLRDVGTWSARDVVLGSADGRVAQRVLQVTAVEWNLFDATRTPPALGRPFRADDEAPGAAPVIVLSHALWSIAFGGDSAIVGQMIRLNGTSTQVIGVMPPGYGFPVAAESWVPQGAAVREATEAGRYAVNAFGRLVDGATPEGAELELTALLRRARDARPVAPADTAGPAPTVSVRTFPMAQLGNDGPAFFTIINVMATLILLLACINVGNLLLARANERARELAVRLALGASRGRLAMQSLWEPVVLVLISGTLATALAAAALSFVNQWAHTRLEGNMAFWWTWGMDRPTLFAAGGFMTLTVAVLGGVMAARATNTRFNDVLRDGGARDGGQRAGRTARVLVVDPGGGGGGAALLWGALRNRRLPPCPRGRRLRHAQPSRGFGGAGRDDVSERGVASQLLDSAGGADGNANGDGGWGHPCATRHRRRRARRDRVRRWTGGAARRPAARLAARRAGSARLAGDPPARRTRARRARSERPTGGGGDQPLAGGALLAWSLSRR